MKLDHPSFHAADLFECLAPRVSAVGASPDCAGDIRVDRFRRRQDGVAINRDRNPFNAARPIGGARRRQLRPRVAAIGALEDARAAQRARSRPSARPGVYHFRICGTHCHCADGEIGEEIVDRLKSCAAVHTLPDAASCVIDPDQIRVGRMHEDARNSATDVTRSQPCP